MKMSKKEIKASQQKSALKLRLLDMAAGALGDYEGVAFDSTEIGSLDAEMGLEVFGRFLGAIVRTFPDRADLVGPRYLDNYETLNSVVDFLHARGVRA